jgi:hypothetical protein
MKLRPLFFLFVLALLVSACDSNPAWDGPSPTGKADKLAAETCKCLYTMVGEEAGWDRDAILEAVKAIRKKTKGDLQMEVLASEDASIQKALSGEEDFSLKMDECDCMKPVQDGLLEQGVSFEEMMAKVDLHCLLGAFYN